MSASGAPFAASVNPAYAILTPGLGNASCDISWTPDTLQKRIAAYPLSLRIQEQHGSTIYFSDKTLFLNVTASVGIEKASTTKEPAVIFPNPSNGTFTLQFNLEKRACVKVEVLDSELRLVSQLSDKLMNAGNNVILNTNSVFQKGMYPRLVLFSNYQF